MSRSPFLPHEIQPDCQSAALVSDDRAREILATQRPFQPLNLNLFYSYDHPDWESVPSPRFAQGPEPTESEVRDDLQGFLERRFTSSPERVSDGMAIFSDVVARQKFPEPTLRAALAALTGTLGEPAIEFLLYRTPVTLVHFSYQVDPGTGLPVRVAAASIRPDQTRYIIFDRHYRFNPFASLSALMLHEALHCGNDEDNAGQPEELVASAVQALLHMEMLIVDPTLAGLNDPLTREVSNPLTLARLNSGPVGTEHLSLFAPNASENIDPLSIELVPDFRNYYERYISPTSDAEYSNRITTGNWLLWRVLEELASHTIPDLDADNIAFDDEALGLVDQHHDVLTPQQLIMVASALDLAIDCG